MPFTSCANTNHDVTTFEIYEKVENIKLSNTEHDFFFPKNQIVFKRLHFQKLLSYHVETSHLESILTGFYMIGGLTLMIHTGKN